MSSSYKVKHSQIRYYDSNLKEPALTDEEAALVLLQMRTGSVPLLPSRQSGHGSGSWSQKPAHDGNISGTATYLKGSALTDEKLALLIRRLRMSIVREHESGSLSQKPMHDGNISGTAYDSNSKGPALTDEEAALILLQMRTGNNLLPASNHLQREFGSQSRKPMHDNSAYRIPGTTPHSTREPKNATPSQSIDYGLDVTICAASSTAEYSGLDETNLAKFNGHDLDGKFSDTASGMKYYVAGGMNSPRRVGHHSDATISDPELNKYQFLWETTSKIIDSDSDATISDPDLDNKYQFVSLKTSGKDSDATISDPELKDKYQFIRETIVLNGSDATISDPQLDNKDNYVHHNSGSLMVSDHDPDGPISIPQSNADDPPESSTAAPQSQVKRNKNTANKTDLDILSERCCRLCPEPGHNCKACPTIPCTYEGCKERGHVKSYCHKRLTEINKYKSDWQRDYVSRKRKAAASAGQDSIMTHKQRKHSEH